MNKVFIIGRIIKNIEFNFIYRKSKITIGKTKIELLNKSIIEIYGYDEIADYMYSNIEKNDVIVVEGKMRSNKVEVECLMEL